MKKDIFQERVKLLTKVFFSLAFLIVGLVSLFGYPDDSGMKTLGAGFLGTIIGYWVK